MDKRAYFLQIFKQAEKKYLPIEKRLAADGWKKDWQTLIATIMSAQTRDETTIPVAENLFNHYSTLQKLANAHASEVKEIIRRVNYSTVKSKNVVAAANYLLDHHKGKVPDTIEALIEIPGVGRKTANLVLAEIHNKDGICVDTHVHRIANVLGLVHTKTPTQTEFALMRVAPRNYWSRINRIFVLWGKEVRGKNKQAFLDAIS